MIRKGFPAAFLSILMAFRAGPSAFRLALAAFASLAALSGCAGGGHGAAPERSAADTPATSSPNDTNAAAASAANAARRDSSALEDLLTELERAVGKHDKPALVALLDPDYKAKQLERIYKGNANPFLNTVFCGRVVGTDQLYCLDFDAISGFTRKTVTRETDWAQAGYIAETSERKIETKLKVMLRKGQAPGLIGSQGFTQIE